MKTLITLSLSFILLTSCGKTEPIISQNSTPIQATQSGSAQSSVFDETAMKKDQETYQTAMKLLDESKCQDISNETSRSMCNSSIIPLKAKRDKDESLCDKLTDSMSKNSCASPIVLEKAKSKGDTGICGKLGDDMSRNACIAAVAQVSALSSLDPSKCSAITDDMRKRSCEQSTAMKRATEKGDKSACESLDPMTKSSCEMQAIISENAKSGNTSSCDSLDSMMKSSCIIQSLVTRAVATKDFTVCGSNKEIQAGCEIQSAKKILETSLDPKYCEYLGGDKNQCLVDISARKAIGERKKETCDTLENISNQRNCRDMYDRFESEVK